MLAIGLAESYRVSAGWATPTGTGFNNLKGDYEPGDLGFDPLGLKPSDPVELKVLQTKELNNGRLAMLAIAGFTLQELVPPHRESECGRGLRVWGCLHLCVAELDDCGASRGCASRVVPPAPAGGPSTPLGAPPPPLQPHVPGP